MIKNTISLFLVVLLTVTLATASITSSEPSGTVVTNENTIDIFAQTNNPLFEAFRTPTTTYIELEFDGSNEIDCVISGPVYNCSLSSVDISSKEGTYDVNITDNNGTENIAVITIDHSITANDFNFQATDYNVSYTDGCVDNLSGIDVSVAQYSSDNFVSDINNISGSSMILSSGDYDFRGYCKDNAGNEAYTGVTSYTIPASPPDLIKVTELPSNVICNTGFPCNYSIDGAGSPVELSLKLTFDKEANISVSVNDGATSSSEDFYEEHLLSLSDMRDGVHEVLIAATDGVNSEDFIVNLNVTNTGGTGNVTIDVRGSIIIDPPVDPYVDFLGTPVVERNNVFPGEWSIVKYTVEMFAYDWTRYKFETSNSAFETPIQIFCGENYNGTSQDIVNDSLSYNITSFGTYDETQSAITCPGTGNLTAGYVYDVYVKYPIAENAEAGSIAGLFSVGLYNSSI